MILFTSSKKVNRKVQGVPIINFVLDAIRTVFHVEIFVLFKM